MPAEAKVDVTKLGWQALLSASVQKIAIANPAHAPYGRAAVAALQSAGIYEQVKSKLVYGENISQAAQFVQSGNAQAGIVALALAVSPGMKDGKRWEIPADMHPAIEQCAIIFKNARNKTQARAFLQFVKSADAQATLEKFGFTIPEVNVPAAGKP
jgi:molybdate transport system substrate-binding protein